MPNRLRLFDLRLSQLPGLLGLCAGDSVGLAQYVNRAQTRLLQAKEAGDEGWWGTWAEMAFILTTPLPPQTCCMTAFLTMPRSVARVEYINICDRPIPLQNQFYEYLAFGNGRVPKHFARCPHLLQTYTRNTVPTFIDMTNPPQFLAAFWNDPGDVGKRVLFQGMDPAGNVIYNADGFQRVIGQYVVNSGTPSTQPFAQTTLPFSQITGIQKDITNAPVQIMQIDPTTGTQVLLLTMEPTEQVASYRRYLINPMPINCCFGPAVTLCSGPPPSIPQTIPNTTTITVLAKLEAIPVSADTDYLVIQNQEAITEECQAIRYEAMDIPTAKEQAALHHKVAIGLLNGELTHYLGLDSPSVGFFPFGAARLSRRRIGSMI